MQAHKLLQLQFNQKSQSLPPESPEQESSLWAKAHSIESNISVLV